MKIIFETYNGKKNGIGSKESDLEKVVGSIEKAMQFRVAGVIQRFSRFMAFECTIKIA